MEYGGFFETRGKITKANAGKWYLAVEVDGEGDTVFSAVRANGERIPGGKLFYLKSSIPGGMFLRTYVDVSGDLGVVRDEDGSLGGKPDSHRGRHYGASAMQYRG